MSDNDVEEWVPSSLSEISVMVVDDDSLITRIVTGSLKSMGIDKVYAMNDPRQALDFVAEGLRGVNLVICDLMMPDIDGLTILDEVRKMSPKLPFMMLTADGSSETVKQAIEKGVSGYVVKPFTINDLQEKVQRTIVRAYGPEAGTKSKKQSPAVETDWD